MGEYEHKQHGSAKEDDVLQPEFGGDEKKAQAAYTNMVSAWREEFEMLTGINPQDGAAVAKWQQQHGLHGTGKIRNDTIQKARKASGGHVKMWLTTEEFKSVELRGMKGLKAFAAQLAVDVELGKFDEKVARHKINEASIACGAEDAHAVEHFKHHEFAHMLQQVKKDNKQRQKEEVGRKEENPFSEEQAVNLHPTTRAALKKQGKVALEYYSINVLASDYILNQKTAEEMERVFDEAAREAGVNDKDKRHVFNELMSKVVAHRTDPRYGGHAGGSNDRAAHAAAEDGWTSNRDLSPEQIEQLVRGGPKFLEHIAFNELVPACRNGHMQLQDIRARLYQLARAAGIDHTHAKKLERQMEKKALEGRDAEFRHPGVTDDSVASNERD
jgi:hypothetical protein